MFQNFFKKFNNLAINNVFSKKRTENKGKGLQVTLMSLCPCFNSKFPGWWTNSNYPTLFLTSWHGTASGTFFSFSVQHVGCSLLYNPTKEVSRCYGGVLLRCAWTTHEEVGRNGAACAIKVVGGAWKKKHLQRHQKCQIWPVSVTWRDELTERHASNTPSSHSRRNVSGNPRSCFFNKNADL